MKQEDLIKYLLSDADYHDKIKMSCEQLDRNTLFKWSIKCADSVQHLYTKDNIVKDCIAFLKTIKDIENISQDQKDLLDKHIIASAAAAYASAAAASEAAAPASWPRAAPAALPRRSAPWQAPHPCPWPWHRGRLSARPLQRHLQVLAPPQVPLPLPKAPAKRQPDACHRPSRRRSRS